MCDRLVQILLLAVAAAFLAGAARQSARTEHDEMAFFARHWRAPIEPQGAPPASFGPLESSLHPDACGMCHPAQFEAWRESIHAASMGSGVAGQVVELARTDPAQVRACYTCHAPLAEQRPGGPGYDPTLTPLGIVCGSCHVRKWQRFGPPRRDGSLLSSAPRSSLPHNGVTRTPAFLRSEFCKDCHQFPPSGYALNGKLLQDTYEEWKASPASARGVQCQDCHMPDRLHRWRGIHDPDMVRTALTFAVGPDQGAITLTITNSGAGHLVPTYVTPRIVVSGELIDAQGRAVEGSRRESIIGRGVTLDLEQELFDTRLAPGQRAVFRYERPARMTGTVRLAVVVQPDHFYTGFFEALLRGDAGRGEAQIRAALEASRRSSFTVFEQLVLPGGGLREPGGALRPPSGPPPEERARAEPALEAAIQRAAFFPVHGARIFPQPPRNAEGTSEPVARAAGGGDRIRRRSGGDEVLVGRNPESGLE